MTIRISRVLSFAEYQQMQDDAIARGWWRNDRRMFTPGMAWSCPWYFDPRGELKAYADANPGSGFRDGAMFARREDDDVPFLSVHYWRDWSAKRAPIAVVCPNGEVWEVDRKSSNGDGWRVTGDLPDLTCEPSIVVDGYHGYLRGGLFTADLEGRGPVGIVKPIVERVP